MLEIYQIQSMQGLQCKAMNPDDTMCQYTPIWKAETPTHQTFLCNTHFRMFMLEIVDNGVPPDILIGDSKDLILLPCPDCGLTMEPSHKYPNQWWCDHCARHFEVTS